MQSEIISIKYVPVPQSPSTYNMWTSKLTGTQLKILWEGWSAKIGEIKNGWWNEDNEAFEEIEINERQNNAKGLCTLSLKKSDRALSINLCLWIHITWIKVKGEYAI